MTQKSIYFDQFCLDTSNAALTRCDVVVPLTPKAFSLLQYLVDNADQLATKDNIFEHVWADRVVTDAALTVCVRELRAALGDNARDPRYIETVSKRGYRFIAQIRSLPDSKNTIPIPAVPAELPAPFVGRDHALDELNRCKNSADSGDRQVMFITGEPGIGKTTLIETFLSQQKDTSSTWIARGQCIEQYGVGEAYMPVLDSISHLSKLDEETVISILQRHAPTLLAQLPALCTKDAFGDTPLNIRPERLLREITDALEVMAGARLLIVVLEDLHWSDIATTELLSFLARRDGPARLLVIASFRPSDSIISNHPIKKICDDLQRRHCGSSIQLECLSEHHVSEYLREFYPKQSFPDDFCAKVSQKSEGNPLFMVNLLSFMQRVELVKQDNNNWNLSSNTTEIDQCVSDDIHDVINQQVEKLSPIRQNILEAASTASEPGGLASEFTLEEVAAVLQLPDLDIENDLDWLARSNIFIRSLGVTEWPDGTLSNSYGFIHGLYQKVLYDRVSALHRVQYHRKLSQRLESGYISRKEDIASKLAVHFELGRQHSQAVSYLTTMAEISASRGADREALLTLERAGILLGKIEPSAQKSPLEISVLLLQASCITASQGNATPSIEACYQRALKLCEQIGDTSGKFRSMFGLRSFYVISGEMDKAYELATALLALATTVGETALILEAHVGLANSEFFVGNHQTCHDHVLAGIKLYDQQAHAEHALLYGLDPGVFCHARASQTAWFLGFPEQALSFVRQSVELAEMRQHPYSLVLAIQVNTQIHLYLGQTKAAIESAQRGKQLAIEHEFSFMHAWALHLSAWALAQDGKRQQALEEIERARNAPRPLSLYADSYILAFMAESYLALGLAEEGLNCLSSATLGRSYDAERGYLRSRLTAMLATNPTAIRKAIELAKKTLLLCQQQNARMYELKTTVCLANMYSQLGDNQLALGSLLPLIATFDEGLETADIKQAIALASHLENVQTVQVTI